MMPLYIGSFLFGGILLGASVLGGHGDHAAGGHDLVPGSGHGVGDGDGGGHHPGANGGGEHSADAVAHRGFGLRQLGRLPIFSLGFWAFATAFFGLAGAALTWVGSGLGVFIPAIAALFGVGSGVVASRVLASLSGSAVGLLGDASSHVGREGRALLPIGPRQRGKIRLTIGGVNTDLIAETDSDVAIAAGDTVLITSLRDNVAIVVTIDMAPPRLTDGGDFKKREPS